MTTLVDVCNRMLQKIGTRTTVTQLELDTNNSNEAIQFNLMYEEVRDTLLRKAPWNCALKTANLTLITAAPGTPQNPIPPTALWSPGTPPPPWLFEYQYPADCLAARWIVPMNQTPSGVAGMSGMIGSTPYWSGPPIRYKVQADQFFSAATINLVLGGTRFAVGDIITLPQPTLGVPAQLRVLTVNAAGAVLTFAIVSVMAGAVLGGSYFAPVSGVIGQGTTTGTGTGFSCTVSNWVQNTQRVVLTSQPDAVLTYTQRIDNPNLFDPSFRDALYLVGAASLSMALMGNRDHANGLVQQANASIAEARVADANEGLSVNDVTPDWIRARGYAGLDYTSGPYQSYDWGSYFPLF